MSESSPDSLPDVGCVECSRAGRLLTPSAVSEPTSLSLPAIGPAFLAVAAARRGHEPTTRMRAGARSDHNQYGCTCADSHVLDLERERPRHLPNPARHGAGCVGPFPRW